MAERSHILVVDDDPAILDALRRGLELEGFVVMVAAEGASALRMLAGQSPEAVVLDVGLPDLNGRIVAARMRATGNQTPILILSALDQVDERIAGLEAGADDYLIKPFAIEELVARLRALLRRAATNQPEHAPHSTAAPFRVGRLFLDPLAGHATWDGNDLKLTRRELALLEALARNPEIVITRDQLLDLVWGYDFAPETKVVDVFISYLRRKLTQAGAPTTIETVRGVGFVLHRR